MNKVRTRFAPSPTGSLHLGSLRTALFAYGLSKKDGGDFILRIEDTDKKREIKGGIETIKKTLEIFDLFWDEFYVQSQRLEIYRSKALELVKSGHAFYCTCEARNAKEQGYSKILRDPCRDKNLKSGAVKLLVPDAEDIGYRDFVLDKDISWNSSEVSDTTLLKSDGYPTYHMAVVVDDNEMKISHVLRGHDWLPSTPIHLLVYKYLGYDLPQIGHLTDILDPTGGKLSKRKGSFSVDFLLKEGYLPEAILNFILLLGWAPKDNREMFSLDEFVKAFDIKGLQKANPVYNRDKLDWFNGEYIRKLSVNNLNEKFQKTNPEFMGLEKEKQLAITTLIRERITKLGDLNDLAGFFFKFKKADTKLFGGNFKNHLSKAVDELTNSKWELEKLNDNLLAMIKREGFKTGDFFMDLRIAVTGSKFTPPINESIIILGRDETLERIKSYL